MRINSILFQKMHKKQYEIKTNAMIEEAQDPVSS